jgi:hypothetical protein
MEHANSIKVIDTHEHQRDPQELGLHDFNFWGVLLHSYVSSDLITAGGERMTVDVINEHDLDKLWDRYGKYLDYAVQTSYYRSLLQGFRILYHLKEDQFTKENIQQLSTRIKTNYADYPAWFNAAFKQAGYQIMLLDQCWNPINFTIDTDHFALIFRIDDLVTAVINGVQDGHKNIMVDNPVYKAAAAEGIKINSLNNYLTFSDHLFKKFIDQGAVALKCALAYERSLRFEKISNERAEKLFFKSPTLSKEQQTALQDFVFNWIVEKSIEYDLPIQIHTGYFAGNGNIINYGDPLQLNNLFLDYPKARFILFHGGYPWASEFVALGKMFPNVYLDLVWLTQICKSAAIRTFDEMLDCVPYNKFLWGGDCLLIEESVGALQISKEVIAHVLTGRVSRGEMTEDVAREIISGIFRDNAARVFKLK